MKKKKTQQINNKFKNLPTPGVFKRAQTELAVAIPRMPFVLAPLTDHHKLPKINIQRKQEQCACYVNLSLCNVL
jgi:hypothetical protein